MRHLLRIQISLFIVFLGGSKYGISQEQIVPKKCSYVDSTNHFYTQTSLPLYLFISTEPNATNPTQLKNINDLSEKSEKSPFFLDGDGVHHIHHFDAIDKKDAVFLIYADGKAPAIQCQFINCQFFQSAVSSFYGVGLTMKLITSDDMSGVNNVYYSINRENYKFYNNELNIKEEGEKIIKYYATDKVGNISKMEEKKIILDLSAPITYYNVTGISDSKIISSSTKIYLEAVDKISGVSKTFFRFDNEKDRLYNGQIIDFKYLSEGEHVLYVHSVDNVINIEEEKKLEFYYDKTAPIVATDILGDRFIVNDQIYFSGRSKLKITAIDNKIGVKDVKYSVDNSEFDAYSEPFYLPSKQGLHIVKYFAIDSIGNETSKIEDNQYLEFKQNINKIFVDLTGPTIFNKFIGAQLYTRDSLFINSQTKLECSQFDAESGPQKIVYTLDGVPIENEYKQALNFSKDGFHKMEIIGYDNVNNRNIKNICFIVDNEGPTITWKFSVKSIGIKDSLDIYPPFAVLFLAPYDDLSGIANISYKLNNEPQKEYIKGISKFPVEQINTLIIYATDNLENTSTQEIKFFISKK